MLAIKYKNTELISNKLIIYSTDAQGETLTFSLVAKKKNIRLYYNVNELLLIVVICNRIGAD